MSMDVYATVEPEEHLKPLIKKIGIGINDELLSQLIKKSRQPHIISSTPKDVSERFGDINMLNKWLEQGRVFHWLIGDNNDLAGVIWYGKKKFPVQLTEQKVKANNTFAIRIYENYVGHGLAKPFMFQSLGLYHNSLKEKGDNNLAIWLSTSINNLAAVAVYTKFGYKEVFRDEEQVYMELIE